MALQLPYFVGNGKSNGVPKQRWQAQNGVESLKRGAIEPIASTNGMEAQSVRKPESLILYGCDSRPLFCLARVLYLKQLPTITVLG